MTSPDTKKVLPSIVGKAAHFVFGASDSRETAYSKYTSQYASPEAFEDAGGKIAFGTHYKKSVMKDSFKDLALTFVGGIGTIGVIEGLGMDSAEGKALLITTLGFTIFKGIQAAIWDGSNLV